MVTVPPTIMAVFRLSSNKEAPSKIAIVGSLKIYGTCNFWEGFDINKYKS
jgi:hypothetical protein